MTLDFKPTNHSYYCSTTRWDQHRDEMAEFDCWEDFKDDWCPNGIVYDDDLIHLFRFDFQYKYEDETDDNTGPMQLLLFFMLQRKGLFVPVIVNNITEADMPEITEFLQKRWEYLKGQWAEFSKEPVPGKRKEDTHAYWWSNKRFLKEILYDEA